MENSLPKGNVLQFRSKQVNDDRSANTLFMDARKAEENDDPVEALRLYRRVLEKNPAMAGAHVNMSTIYLAQSKVALAEECCRNALAIDQNYAPAHYNLGQCMEKTPGHDEEAISHYIACLQIAGACANARFNLACLYEKHDMVRQAVENFRCFLEQAPLDDLQRPYAETRIFWLQLSDIHIAQPFPRSDRSDKMFRPRSRSARRRQSRIG